jgi:hypothetical protein
MKTLCCPLFFLLLLCAATSCAQQIALVNAPAPVAAPAAVVAAPATHEAPVASGESTSLALPGSPAIMPVAARPFANPRTRFAGEDWSLLAAAAALRFGDYKSTVKCLSDPANFREAELPEALVQNHPALGAFEAATVVANYYSYRFLVRHNHRTLARIGQTINLSAVGLTVGHNYYELQKYWPTAIGNQPRP